MTLHAVTLAFTDHEGALRSVAVISLEARYFSSLTPQMKRAARHYVTPAQWKAIDRQVRDGLPTRGLPLDSPLVAIVASNLQPHGASWLSTIPITIETPDEAPDALDAHLRASLQGYRPRLKLRQD